MKSHKSSVSVSTLPARFLLGSTFIEKSAMRRINSFFLSIIARVSGLQRMPNEEQPLHCYSKVTAITQPANLAFMLSPRDQKSACVYI